MSVKRIESLHYGGEGFRPLLVRPGWQVAQLNDRADLHADTVGKVERHDATDEVFLLVKGAATLIAAEESSGGGLAFECVAMAQGVTYTISKGLWHTIVTTPGMQVMIVERDGTDGSDVIRRELTAGEREALRKGVRLCAG